MMEQGGGAASALSLKWKFSQIFEPEMVRGKSVDNTEEITSDSEESEDDKVSVKKQTDVISTVQFDKTGDLIATGDCGGDIVLYERCDLRKSGKPRKTVERMDRDNTPHFLYRFKTQFQIHETEVDYLLASKIESKIKKITWCPAPNAASFLLSTNDKTIKLWKAITSLLSTESVINLLVLVS
ncbi:hypothetical protein QQ045_016315 [Rhodiola kirilowii]